MNIRTYPQLCGRSCHGASKGFRITQGGHRGSFGDPFLALLLILALLGLALIVALIASIFVACFWWLWMILVIVFVWFRRGAAAEWIFRWSLRLLIAAVVLNAIGLILWLAFPQLRDYDFETGSRAQTTHECEGIVQHGPIFPDTTGFAATGYALVGFVYNGDTQYALLAPGEYTITRPIDGYVWMFSRGCSRSIALDLSNQAGADWASSTVVNRLFD